MMIQKGPWLHFFIFQWILFCWICYVSFLITLLTCSVRMLLNSSYGIIRQLQLCIILYAGVIGTMITMDVMTMLSNSETMTEVISDSLGWNLPFMCWIVLKKLNTLKLRQNGQHFADNIFKCIFFNENLWISIKNSLKFVPKGPRCWRKEPGHQQLWYWSSLPQLIW